MNLPVVAIIGRPNVGKSMLFNRLLGRRKAIVDKASGITRDRLYVDLTWRGETFRLVDTGGVDLSSRDKISQLVRNQVMIAIKEAGVILFTCDGTNGVTALDEDITSWLRKSAKTIFLVVNKVDNENLLSNTLDFYQLGLNKLYPISAMHGLGIGELLDEIVAHIGGGEVSKEPQTELIKIAIVGRPNVGKSSFLNALLKEERVITDSLPGTTRDSIDTYFKRDNKSYILIDTAGIRHLRKLKSAVDVYSVSRAKEAIRRSDVALVLIDAPEGIRRDDLRILTFVINQDKGFILVVNKWDKVSKMSIEKYKNTIKSRANFIGFAPTIFTSSLKGTNVLETIDLVEEVVENSTRRITTPRLNKVLKDALSYKPPPTHKGKRPKLYYITQSSIKPPGFLIFATNAGFVKKEYVSYIENKLRKNFNLSGTPIQIKFREKT